MMGLSAFVDFTNLVMLVGGMAGGIGRAVMGQHPTLTKRTLYDVAVGALLPPAGVALGLLPIQRDANPLGLFAVSAIIGMFGSYVLVWLLWKLGVFKEDIRADKPDAINGGTP